MGRRNIDKICLSKTRYETKEDAEDTVLYLLETKQIELYVYECPICRGFHLTSKR